MHKNLHERSLRYQQLERWAFKTSEKLAKWKIVETVSTKYLQVNPVNVPFVTLETVIFYNLLLIPVFFPVNMISTIAIISLYRRHNKSNGGSDSSSGAGNATTNTNHGASGPSNSSHVSSKKAFVQYDTTLTSFLYLLVNDFMVYTFFFCLSLFSLSHPLLQKKKNKKMCPLKKSFFLTLLFAANRKVIDRWKLLPIYRQMHPANDLKWEEVISQLICDRKNIWGSGTNGQTWTPHMIVDVVQSLCFGLHP
ncbi:hypothetical protein RFI_40105 [Reticulomyxa filosa]|uniref:Uncharacterized protein n=1 Tax=Reticulomyxa filosa TaxID=46433 RepID=X6L9P4_RETFI|nr:hypothetical protein RFI_40105 [Reticulomyxa filosa]|eukprot:ETN97424.1 hypothetical protein RFI_40105 [Reticulomyxa filosa]